DGISYQTAVIKKLELFPTKTGELVLEPLVVQADAVVKRQRDRFNFNFDSFFNDDFFGQTVRRKLTAPGVKFQVKPLPSANKPAGFNNIVGKFSIKSEIDKTDVTTNEAVSLKIKIAGSGNIKLIDAPKVNVSSDFEQYEPKSEEKISRTGNSITGEKIFEYVFLPRLAGRQKIGAAVFSYFDPKAKKYVTLRTNEITVNVAQGKDMVQAYPANLSRDEIKLIGTDIRFIKLKPLEWKRTDERFYTSYLFFIFIIAPLLLVGMTVLYNNHLERISSDVSYRRNRRASKAAEKRLKEANVHLQHNESEQFYAALSSVLRGYVADKLNISEAGFLTNEVKEMLKGKNVDEKLSDKYIDLINTCDYLRFAPAESKNEDMKNIYKESKKTIVTLERFFK
ncbi:protein BatD, partial [bacterium]|nr:protein BatD [bacterium]